MKKIKCIKCGLRFKDREDPEDGTTVNKNLCWNCRFIWKCIGMVLHSFPSKINRYIQINLDDIIIRKNTKVDGNR